MKEYFVDKNSVVRKIWGNADTILLIFAGASAEFALNKAVDWLYFTGRLPADPLGRLFSTVSYAQAIVFSEKEGAFKAIDGMSKAHASVEAERAQSIPDWAYRDVLFMLIDYSVRSFEVLERRLTPAEKREIFNVFYRMGSRMKLQGLPTTWEEWKMMRQEHLQQNLQFSCYTADLFKQYRKHLGPVRYRILLEAQTLLAPPVVGTLLNFREISLLHPLVAAYKVCRSLKVDWLLKAVILPPAYRRQIAAFDMQYAEREQAQRPGKMQLSPSR